jgi:hypothetical protein
MHSRKSFGLIIFILILLSAVPAFAAGSWKGPSSSPTNQSLVPLKASSICGTTASMVSAAW